MSQTKSPASNIIPMEINGHPYYIKSKENVPYLYDIDTHDEVGYWSSKKGQYVMFSLYNRLIKKKKITESNEYCNDGENEYETTETDSSSNSQEDSSSSLSSTDSELEVQEKKESDSDSDLTSQEEDILDSDSESEANTHISREPRKTRMDTYSLIFVFLLLFVYLTLQKEFQSIYLDFVFLILINLLNTLKVFEFMNDE